MFAVFDQLGTVLPGIMLVFARISAMLVALPIFGYAMVSVRIRVLLAVALTAVVVPVSTAAPVTEITTLPALILGISKEVAIGLLIGFGARLIFEGFSMAGGVVGLQMGFAIVNVMDPSSRQHQPIISQFWLLLIITLFLVTNSHHFLVEILVQNFSRIPVGGGEFSPELGETVVLGGSKIFQIVIRFAAPIMVFLLLVDTAIAFMARIMPQMNIFLVALPLKIGLGIFVLVISLKMFLVVFESIYGDMVNYVSTIILQFEGS